MTTSAAVSATDFAFVQQLMREDSGFVLDGDKQYLVETRLAPLLAQQGLPSVAALVAQVRREPYNGLRRATVEALLNGETTFFRDVFLFNALRDVVLPGLCERRSYERRLRIWSAACSTGQEPYSLAMLLAESFPSLADWDVRIMATDVSSAHVARAKAGRYAQFEVNRGLPAPMLVKYFDQEGTEWVVDPAIRRRVTFAEMNLFHPWPDISSMDIVLLRNVMIYWDAKSKAETLGRMRDTLRADGCLVLGAAETTYYVHNGFERLGADSPCCFRVNST